MECLNMPDKTTDPFPAIKSAPPVAKNQEAPGFSAVQDFLQRFGYLQPGTFDDNKLDEATAEGIALYQQRQGLVPTGTFDEQVRDQMVTYRCGMPDLDRGIAFSTRCAWPNPNLTFAFEDGTNDIPGSAEFQAVR